MAVGVVLAVLLDQKVRGEGLLRNRSTHLRWRRCRSSSPAPPEMDARPGLLGLGT